MTTTIIDIDTAAEAAFALEPGYSAPLVLSLREAFVRGSRAAQDPDAPDIETAATVAFPDTEYASKAVLTIYRSAFMKGFIAAAAAPQMMRVPAAPGTTVENYGDGAHAAMEAWKQSPQSSGAPRSIGFISPVPATWVEHLASGFEAGSVILAPILAADGISSEQGTLYLSGTIEEIDAVREGNVVLATTFTPRWPVLALGQVNVVEATASTTTVTTGDETIQYVIERPGQRQVGGPYPTKQDALDAATVFAQTGNGGTLTIRGYVHVGDDRDLAAVVPSVVRATAEAVFATFEEDAPIAEYVIVRGTGIRRPFNTTAFDY